MKVSVIVPVYNTEKYLRRCLDSLVNQTLDDIEIIIIDDKSPDNSALIIYEYKKKYDNKIKVIHNKTNKGIGYNRNIGIKKSSGKYIMFIDSDDYLDRSACEKLYSKAENEQLDLVLCNFHKMLEKDDELEEITPDFVIPYFENTTLDKNPNLLLEVNLAPWNKLYKKELLNGVSFPENLKYEDAIVVMKAMARAKKMGIVDEKLNYYLVRSKSETTVMDKRVFDILKVTNMIIEELKNHSYYNKIEKYVSAWCTRNLFRYTLQQKNQKDKKLASRFIDEVFEFLDSNFPCWKNNEIWKKRSFLKRVIEGNKTLTKIYCKAF